MTTTSAVMALQKKNQEQVWRHGKQRKICEMEQNNVSVPGKLYVTGKRLFLDIQGTCNIPVATLVRFTLCNLYTPRTCTSLREFQATAKND